MFTKIDWKDTSNLHCTDRLLNLAHKEIGDQDTYYLEYGRYGSTYRENLVGYAIQNYLLRRYKESIKWDRVDNEELGDVVCLFIYGEFLKSINYEELTTQEIYDTLCDIVTDSGDINACEDKQIRYAWHHLCQTNDVDIDNDKLYDKFVAFCLSEAEISYFDIRVDYDKALKILKEE